MHFRAAAPMLLFPFKEIAPLFSAFVVFFVFKFSLTTKTRNELSNNLTINFSLCDHITLSLISSVHVQFHCQFQASPLSNVEVVEVVEEVEVVEVVVEVVVGPVAQISRL